MSKSSRGHARTKEEVDEQIHAIKAKRVHRHAWRWRSAVYAAGLYIATETFKKDRKAVSRRSMLVLRFTYD